MSIDSDKLILYVLNEKNVPIERSYVEGLLKKYGVKHKIKDMCIFQTAMIHESYVDRDLTHDRVRKIIIEKNIQPIANAQLAMPLQPKSYERLEFLGDGVIHCILADYLYQRYMYEQEGFMTQLRTKLENKTMFAHLATKLGFRKYAVIARNIEQGRGRERDIEIFEDCFEAFVGALYVETGYDECRTFIVNIIQKEIDISELLYIEDNFKALLLKYYHTMRWDDPVYGIDEASEPDENGIRSFKMFVKGYTTNDQNEPIWGKVGFGVGCTKKHGEQEAARDALLRFKKINDDSDDESDNMEFVYS